MGATEEIGKVAQTVTESLKSTPLLLSIVIFNVIFVLMVGYLSYHTSERWNDEAERWATLVRSCLPH